MEEKKIIAHEKARKKSKRKAVVSHKECVACGSCEGICPIGVITVHKGIYARIIEENCIGCGKCKAVCPASVIEMEERTA